MQRNFNLDEKLIKRWEYFVKKFNLQKPENKLQDLLSKSENLFKEENEKKRQNKMKIERMNLEIHQLNEAKEIENFLKSKTKYDIDIYQNFENLLFIGNDDDLNEFTKEFFENEFDENEKYLKENRQYLMKDEPNRR